MPSASHDTFYRQSDMFKWDSLPLFEVVRAKQESSLPLKGPTGVSEDMHPYQNTNHRLLRINRFYLHRPGCFFSPQSMNEVIFMLFKFYNSIWPTLHAL